MGAELIAFHALPTPQELAIVDFGGWQMSSWQFVRQQPRQARNARHDVPLIAMAANVTGVLFTALAELTREQLATAPAAAGARK